MSCGKCWLVSRSRPVGGNHGFESRLVPTGVGRRMSNSDTDDTAEMPEMKKTCLKFTR